MANDTRFKKGHAPTPGGGRPKGSGFDKRCKEFSDKYGIPFLEAIVRGNISKKFNIALKPDPELRQKTAIYLCDRGGGKPRQALDLNPGNDTVKFTLSMGNGAK